MPFFKIKKFIKECVSLQVSLPVSSFKYKNTKIRKRVYLFTSKGSITIEATIAIYIFLLVVLFVEGFLMLLNTEFSVQRDINNVAIKASKEMYYGDVINEAYNDNSLGKRIKKEVQNIVKEESYKEFIAVLEKSYLTTSLIQEIGSNSTKFFLCDVAGINTIESSIKDGIIDLVATYRMKMPFAKKYVTFTQRGQIKGWNGIDIRKESNVVYVTPTGQVYHTTTNCPSLSIKISKYIYEDCKEKYKKCSLCVSEIPNAKDSVFITEDGLKYHISLRCSGLTRNIITTDLSSIGDLPECSRCGGSKNDY